MRESLWGEPPPTNVRHIPKIYRLWFLRVFFFVHSDIISIPRKELMSSSPQRQTTQAHIVRSKSPHSWNVSSALYFFGIYWYEMISIPPKPSVSSTLWLWEISLFSTTTTKTTHKTSLWRLRMMMILSAFLFSLCSLNIIFIISQLPAISWNKCKYYITHNICGGIRTNCHWNRTMNRNYSHYILGWNENCSLKNYTKVWMVFAAH